MSDDTALEELLAAHALGALPDDEARIVTERAARDARVRGELDQLTRVVDRLDDDDAPSPEVWGRIASLTRPDAQVLAFAPRVPRIRRIGRLAAVAAACASLAGVAAALTIGPSDEVTQPGAPPSLAEEAAAARRQPGAQHGTVLATDGHASTEVVVLTSGRGFVLGLDVTGGERRGYRLFALTPAGPVLVAALDSLRFPLAFQLPAGTTGLVLSRTFAALEEPLDATTSDAAPALPTPPAPTVEDLTGTADTPTTVGTPTAPSTTIGLPGLTLPTVPGLPTLPTLPLLSGLLPI